MISELLYWGVIVLFFPVSVMFAFVLLQMEEDPTLDTCEKIRKRLEPHLIECFYGFFITFIALVYLTVGIAYLVLGSWPNWFFLSNGYIFRTLIVLVLAPKILKTILKIMLRPTTK
jgi:hypothetical protein